MNIKTKENRLAVTYTMVSVLVVLSLLLIRSPAQAEEYKMQGRVVHAGGNRGIDGVKVEIRYAKDAKAEKETSTKEGGAYHFTVPVSKSYVWITYTPKDTTVLSTDARSDVPNNANPKDLDTIGLVDKDQAHKNIRAALNAFQGAVRYVSAGGDVKSARQFVMFTEPNKYKAAFAVMRKNPELSTLVGKYKLVD